MKCILTMTGKYFILLGKSSLLHTHLSALIGSSLLLRLVTFLVGCSGNPECLDFISRKGQLGWFSVSDTQPLLPGQGSGKPYTHVLRSGFLGTSSQEPCTHVLGSSFLGTSGREPEDQPCLEPC